MDCSYFIGWSKLSPTLGALAIAVEENESSGVFDLFVGDERYLDRGDVLVCCRFCLARMSIKLRVSGVCGAESSEEISSPSATCPEVPAANEEDSEGKAEAKAGTVAVGAVVGVRIRRGFMKGTIWIGAGFGRPVSNEAVMAVTPKAASTGPEWIGGGEDEGEDPGE